jgi:hypothetical protein
MEKKELLQLPEEHVRAAVVNLEQLTKEANKSSER